MRSLTKPEMGFSGCFNSNSVYAESYRGNDYLSILETIMID